MAFLKQTREDGFTLFEVLIALFIFTILSMILMKALHTVIDAQSETQKHAERLRDTQLALLVLSRDVEQAMGRPIINASGKEEGALVGTPRGFSFTHGGHFTQGAALQSSMQRTRYFWEKDTLWRMRFASVDQAPNAKPESRALLRGVMDARFQYLDDKRRFHDQWPLEDQPDQLLPRAIKMTLTLSAWGDLTQLYVISTENEKKSAVPKP